MSFAHAPAVQAQPQVKHVFVLMLENQSYRDSFGTPASDPYLARTLRAQGVLLTDYYAIGHESNDNYLALISGQAPNADTQADCQFYSDFTPGAMGAGGQAIGQGCVYPAWVQTIGNQLSARGLAWRGYMEDMGTNCRHPALDRADSTQKARKGDQYAARHNPFVYFHSVTDGPLCQNDVPFSQFPNDLASAQTTPAYSFITPNLCHDGHDSPCVDGEPGGQVSSDAFLRRWVPAILASPGYSDGGMLVITFDEAGSSDSSACCGEPSGPNSPDPGGPQPGPGGGRVGALILSPYVRPGSTDATPYNHYSLLRSVEDIFALPHLGYAGMAGLRAFGPDVFNASAAPGGGSGSSPARGRIRIRVFGMPRRCVKRDFTVRVVVTAQGLRLVRVRLGRRTLAVKRRARFSLRIHARRLRPGRYRLSFTASDGAGGVQSVTPRFRRCR